MEFTDARCLGPGPDDYFINRIMHQSSKKTKCVFKRMKKTFFFLFSETKKTKTSIDAIDKMPKGQEANVLDAASQGAANAVFLVANIGGTLIAGGSKTFFSSFCFL